MHKLLKISYLVGKKKRIKTYSANCTAAKSEILYENKLYLIRYVICGSVKNAQAFLHKQSKFRIYLVILNTSKTPSVMSVNESNSKKVIYIQLCT